MPLSVKYNGIDITEYITVLEGFTIHGGADWNPTYKEHSAINGADFLETKYKIKEIPMPFAIKEEIEKKYDGLSDALNVSEPKELIFGNKPDRVYHAIPKGNFNFSELNKTSGVGTITWLIPDGLAHSTTERTFMASANADGILEAEIINDGSEVVPISYEITHKHENGYIGIVSEYGAMQYGYIEEKDVGELQKSEILIDYDPDQMMANMVTGGVFASEYANNGAMQVSTINGKKYLELNHTNVGSGSGWHGAGIYRYFPEDSEGNVDATKNWKADAKIWFQGTNAAQTGGIEFCISKGTQVIASMQVWDVNAGSYESYVDLFVGTYRVARYMFDADAKGWANTSGGRMYIQKSGDLFEFGFGDKKFQTRSEEYKDMIANRVQIFISQKGDKGYVEMPWACFESISLRSDSVEYIGDIPNRYREGSVITVDGETGKIYVDGVPMLGDEIIGTQYFKAPPGKTKVQFMFSDFCDPAPDVKVKIREAWL